MHDATPMYLYKMGPISCRLPPWTPLCVCVYVTLCLCMHLYIFHADSTIDPVCISTTILLYVIQFFGSVIIFQTTKGSGLPWHLLRFMLLALSSVVSQLALLSNCFQTSVASKPPQEKPTRPWGSWGVNLKVGLVENQSWTWMVSEPSPWSQNQTFIHHTVYR